MWGGRSDPLKYQMPVKNRIDPPALSKPKPPLFFSFQQVTAVSGSQNDNRLLEVMPLGLTNVSEIDKI
jgi:hypothetical protein